jgi:hypothetical protein
VEYDYKNLTIQVPWRDFVNAICGEENRVHQEMKTRSRKLMKMARAARRKIDRGEADEWEMFDKMFHLFADNYLGAYSTVRAKRLGYKDSARDEYLKKLRFWASFEGSASGDGSNSDQQGEEDKTVPDKHKAGKDHSESESSDFESSDDESEVDGNSDDET